MADEKNRNTLFPQPFNFRHTPLLESGIANRESLVDNQDFGIHGNSNRERETHVHAAGIRLYGIVEEVSNIGKSRDIVEASLHFALSHTEDPAVVKDVLPSGE